MVAADSRAAVRAAHRELADLAAGLPEAAGLGGVAEGLFAVVGLLDRSGHLRRTLADPAVPAQAKRDLLDQLLASQLDPLPMRLLRVAVDQRWSSARDLVDALEEVAVQARFLVAEADGSLDEVEDQLFRFGRIVAHDHALRAVLTDPALPDERKRQVIDALLADRVGPITLGLVVHLVTHPRGRTLEDGLADYARLAASVRQRSVATVTTAVALTGEQERRLGAALARTFGRPVQLQVQVDPTVLGGLAVRVGDEVVDGTVLHRLRAARRTLTR